MDLQGKRVVVMGLGSFGGGVAAARFMARRGARVVITDQAGPEKLAESVAALDGVPIEAMHLGGHRARDFEEADLVVASPAVREDNPLLGLARARGAQVTSEMVLFFQLCRAPIVAVTGSNGKSTTTAMLHAVFREAGRSCWLGGNIGQSLLESVDQIQPDDGVVLELSSFQLEDLDEISRSPRVALVTTFTANHLDRHPTLDAYRLAKQAILRHQSATDLAVLNADDPEVRTWPTPGQTWFYGIEDHGRQGTYLCGDQLVFRGRGDEIEFGLLDVLHVPGEHNISNALGAACGALAMGIGPERIRQGIASFRTLPHRLEPVTEVKGRSFVDDSIATTPESTLAALDTIERPIWLIAGGSDKGLDLGAVARRIAERVDGVALLGQTAEKLERLIRSSSPEGPRPALVRCSTMDEAVAWCFERSKSGDVILLSPACASFGMFHNFVDRARVFRQAAERIGAGCPLNRLGPAQGHHGELQGS